MSSELDEYFSQQDYIEKLKKQVASQRAMKHKANQRRDELIERKVRTIKVLLKLCISGRIDLSNKEIAEVCFVETNSVRSLRRRLINESNNST